MAVQKKIKAKRPTHTRKAQASVEATVSTMPPAKPVRGGAGRTGLIAGVAVLLLAGLGVQTWLMARHRASLTFDMVRTGAPIAKGLGNGELMGAFAVDCDGEGNVYTIDNVSTQDPRLQKFDISDAFVSRYKAVHPAEDLMDPRDMAVAKDGTIAVLLRSGHVVMLDHALKYQGGFNTNLDSPSAIGIDSKGRVLVASLSANKVVLFNKQGHIQGEFGAPGTKSGDLANPARLRVLGDGRIVVLEVTPVGMRFKVFGPDLALQRQFTAPETPWIDSMELGVNGDDVAIINAPGNDRSSDKGVIFYDLNTGKYLGNSKGTTAGDLFVAPGAIGGNPWSRDFFVGTISGYYRAVIPIKAKTR